jgi:hypothetical protein
MGGGRRGGKGIDFFRVENVDTVFADITADAIRSLTPSNFYVRPKFPEQSLAL